MAKFKSFEDAARADGFCFDEPTDPYAHIERKIEDAEEASRLALEGDPELGMLKLGHGLSSQAKTMRQMLEVARAADEFYTDMVRAGCHHSRLQIALEKLEKEEKPKDRPEFMGQGECT